MVEIDTIDRKILAQLQANADQSVAEISEIVGLSPNALWRRIKRMEAEGIILRRVALVDPEKLGIGLSAFVTVRSGDHSEEWLENFAREIDQIPEVVEFYRVSGCIDYLLKIMVADIAHYDRVYKKLIRVAQLTDVSSSFAMETIKHSTAVPF